MGSNVIGFSRILMFLVLLMKVSCLPWYPEEGGWEDAERKLGGNIRTEGLQEDKDILEQEDKRISWFYKTKRSDGLVPLKKLAMIESKVSGKAPISKRQAEIHCCWLDEDATRSSRKADCRDCGGKHRQGDVLEGGMRKTPGQSLVDEGDSAKGRSGERVARKVPCEHCGQSVIDEEGDVVLTRRGKRDARPCEHCGLSLEEGDALLKRRSVERAARPKPCEHCGQSLEEGDVLLKRRSVERAARPKPCEHCGQSLEEGDVLLKREPQERACEHCGESLVDEDETAVMKAKPARMAKVPPRKRRAAIEHHCCWLEEHRKPRQAACCGPYLELPPKDATTPKRHLKDSHEPELDKLIRQAKLQLPGEDAQPKQHHRRQAPLEIHCCWANDDKENSPQTLKRHLNHHTKEYKGNTW